MILPVAILKYAYPVKTANNEEINKETVLKYLIFNNSPLVPLSKIREGMTTKPVPPLLQGKRGGVGGEFGRRVAEKAELTR